MVHTSKPASSLQSVPKHIIW